MKSELYAVRSVLRLNKPTSAVNTLRQSNNLPVYLLKNLPDLRPHLKSGREMTIDSTYSTMVIRSSQRGERSRIWQPVF